MRDSQSEIGSTARGLFFALLIASSVTLQAGSARAETLAHLSRTVWGCVDPNEAASINDASNPARSDPRWLARTATDGQCVTLAPVGQWATLSESYNGLTYVGRRGAAGPTGSFWVPTTALVIDVVGTAPTATKSTSPPAPKTRSEIMQPPTSITSAPPSVTAVKNTTTPSEERSLPPTNSGGRSGTVWFILSACFLFWLFSLAKRRKKSEKKGRTSS